MNPITLPVAALKTALTGLSKIISRRTTLPVLGFVRVERTSEHIELAATDLDSSVIYRMDTPAQGEPRTMLVPFEDLNNITKGCRRDDNLLLSAFKDKVAIRFPVAGNLIEHQCESLAVEEFPPIIEIQGEACPLDADVRQAIRNAFECASTDETRYVIQGAFLDVSKPGAHYVVGTDGRHLFSSNTFTLPLKESLIIPSHRFLGWKAFVDDGEWVLRVNKDNAQRIEIASTHWRFITKSIEGNYPNWRQVIPGAGEFVTDVEFDPAVEEVIRVIARMPGDDPINHKVGIEISGGKVSLLGKSPGADKETTVELTGVKTTGKDVKVFLNRKFLTKALRFGLIRIDVIDPMSPLRFSADGRQMIVMPIRPDTSSPCITTPVTPATTTPPTADANNHPPTADNQERTNMPEHNGTNGAISSSNTADKPALETALAQIEKIKTHHREAITGLNEVTGLLKLAAREQKAGEKEVASVRHTLRSLQGVKI
jgi:DNA polymerase III sliding clamp (beta) subunit (PCNA family)